jgi:hypothetical protein
MFQTNVVDKIKTNFCVKIFLLENREVYETLRKNMAEPDRPQMTWRMRFLLAGYLMLHTYIHTHTQTHTQ